MSLRGESGWQATHAKAFGKERWLGLLAALRGAVTHVALVNPFLPEAAQAAVREERRLQPHEAIPFVCTSLGAELAGEAEDAEDGLLLPSPAESGGAEAGSGAQPAAGVEGTAAVAQPVLAEELMPCYFLDGASALAALALGARPGECILDLCAAPGGKAAMLASRLFAQKEGAEKPGRLVCNESSRPRAQRLQRVLSSFLPAELVAPGTGRVSVSIADAATGSPPTQIQRLGPYDRVLVDAPCTSDRHLAHQGKAALAHWASGAVKSNAERQLELLRCAAAVVRRGGVVLYCTCALSEQENDGVVAKFLKKSGQGFQLEPVAETEGGLELPPGTEATSCGALILPDRTPYGPMYIARLRRL